ncbi:dTMP kinase [Phragmitibacter flavus]|uniref:Thymidylate kinase n=1 Tax=Phragmitibacter flavus TaxID=2576071 RepID=A0A5R8KFL6_9BACT|nr:dTMP kinase [Phragmitibacter flavus]TLD71104.1 dTMP kinase [Phragmitibacter flavus]
MKRPIPGGLLVAVEGIDGAGKTTVAATLAQWCGERGLLCALSKEPTSLSWGMKLRESAASGRLTLDEELDLFHKDREEHAETSIQPALDEDAIMILDRYYWSTAAYQGARGASIAEVLKFNEGSFPVPDLVLLLDLPVEVGQNRIRVRGDQPNEFEEVEAQQRCREIFLQLPKLSEAKHVTVDASKPWREVSRECLRLFQQAALQKVWKTANAKTMNSETLALFGG